MIRSKCKGFYEDASNLSDEEYLKLLEETYCENRELDEKMAEDLVYVSWETDKILENDKGDNIC